MPAIVTPALDLIVNLADRRATGLLALSGSRVVSSPSATAASQRIVRGDTGHCRVRAVYPNLSGERAFDDFDLSLSTVRVALGVPGANPYCLAELDTPFPAAVAQITSPQSVTADLPGTKRITLDPAPYAGHLLLTIDDLDPFEIPFDASAEQLLSLLPAATYKVRKRAANAWEISGLEPGQDVVISSIDVSGLLVPSGLSGEIALNTVALAAAFAAAASGTPPSPPKWLRVTLEVEIDNVKVYQDDRVEIAREIINLTNLVPAPIPPSDFATLSGQIAGKQPAHANLAAVAALIAQAYGLGLLTKADAGAILTYISAQPAHANLTALAGQVIADYGRNLLTASSHAAARLLLALDQVNNTADLAKPISVAQQEALDDLAADTGEALALKAADAAVVHKTGAETIAGPKSFTDLQTLNALKARNVNIEQLANPAAPTVISIGNHEGGLWEYKVVAKLADGTSSAAGPAGSVADGEQTLDAENHNLLTWPVVPDAVSYDVYRTVAAFSPGSLGKIASDVLTNAYIDTGAVGDGSAAPDTNATGGLSLFDGPVLHTPFARDFSRAPNIVSALSKLGLDALEINVGEKAYDASPLASEAYNTLAIQAAIAEAFARGGGVVRVTKPGTYWVSVTSEEDSAYFNEANPHYPFTESSCLVLRSGVLLKMDPGVWIRSIDPTKTVISCVDMEGGGVVGGRVGSVWEPGDPATGHGIMIHVSELGKSNNNLVFDNIKISHVASYGLSASHGDFLNNKYSRLHVHDVGADAIDHKVRPTRSRGVTFRHIVVERFGLREPGVGRAGLDVRGPVTIDGYWAFNFAAPGRACVGLRFNAGIHGEDFGEPSSYSQATGVYIDSGDPSQPDCVGMILANSESTRVVGTVHNCHTGVIVGNASSGFPTSRNAKLSDITVEGSRGRSFDISADDVTVLDCTAVGAVDTFQEKQGNLALGQTVLNTPRPHHLGTMQVWKNGAPLVGGGIDYTINDPDMITLTVPAAVTDVFEIITPGDTGFYASGKRTRLLFPQTQHITTPISGTSEALATLIRDHNSTELPIINRSGQDTELLRFAIERAWSFWQRGTGSSTRLALENILGKVLTLSSGTPGASNIEISPSDVSAYIRINGVSLLDLIATKLSSIDLPVINRPGPDVEQFRFAIERSWSFWQRSTGTSTRLSLESTLLKLFTMSNQTPGASNIEFFASDAGAYIKLNGVAVATTAVLDAALAALVDSSPATLNTLEELANALGDDPNFVTTLTNLIATKAPLASPIFTGTVTIPTLAVTTITQPAWIDLPLDNGNNWVNFGAPFQTAQYRKDTQGRVHLRGFIKSGITTDTTQICSPLPSGYRPAAEVVFAVPYNNGALNMVEIRIASSGAVKLFFATGVATYLSLNGISFSTT